MSSDNLRRKARLWPLLVGLVGAVGLAVVAVLFFNGTNVFAGDPPLSISVPTDKPKVIGKDNTGADIFASGTAVPTKLKAEPAKNAINPPFKNYKAGNKAWHVTSITPRGKLPAPVQITLPLDHVPSKDELVLVAVNHTHTADGWTYQSGTLTQNKRGITFTVTELSWFTPFWTDLGNMIKELKEQFFDGMTSNVFAEAKPPSCQNEDDARTDDYKISSDNKDTIFWCFGLEDGKRVLKVVNHRKYPLVIKTSNMTTKSRGHADLDLSQFVNGGKDVMLNGGDTAIFEVNSLKHDDYAKLNTDLSKASLGLHALDVLVSVLAQIILKVNPHAAGKATEFIKYFLDSRDCVSALGDITNMGNFFKQCFTWDILKEAFNWQVALAAPVMTAFSVINLGQATASAIADSGNGKSKYTVTVSRPKPNPFRSFYLGGSSWHVHGQDIWVELDGTGKMTNEQGPCTFSETSDMCRMEASVRYTVSGSAIIGTLQDVHYVTWGGDPAPEESLQEFKNGQQFRLEHNPKDSHLTKLTWIGSAASGLNGGNDNRCDPYAAQRNDTEQYSLCGA